ncbi:XRE family transcriptional regulator [Mycobacterium sp. DL592]|uniref:XRE family transcriptional regulator n=1 Tax=Mycobacterium sp. DL592 TaxID=2675524 RepID=UPI001420FB66|nr:XRE family transcriptional regulator [Mycobacterium sp. DL592]
MPRTDENGRQLKTLLEYLLDGDVEARDIYDALGISSSTYYRRIKDSDYPNAEELRLLAGRFGLSSPDLQIRFGLMSQEEVWNYVESTPSTVTTINSSPSSRIVRKLSELAPRQDAPPL